ncbi:unnamed protein product [Mytilus edulis]|uniref:Uncharacterized protein n=1 Tax=Mytilus edulis TaxID=6550 RepID=A0A8S3TLW9_MYTED|nr:unnamed protein product [Mytilus edulis]
MQIEKEIKQTRITINNHLDKIQDHIITKLNTTEVNESKIIIELLNLLKEHEREITKFRTNIENIKQHATDLQTFISMKDSITDIVRDDKIPEYCCVATFGENIYQTNIQTYSVTCYDLQGTVKWKFQNEHVLKSLRGISIDNNGNVYVVGESSKTLVLLSANGQQYKTIVTASDGSCSPMSLDYNKITNQLLVSNFSDKAMTFTLT